MSKTTMILLSLVLINPAAARNTLFTAPPAAPAEDTLIPPQWDRSTHYVGRLRLVTRNDGTFGPAEFPSGSGLRYLFRASLLVGAIMGEDTVVCIDEFRPDIAPNGAILVRTSLDPALSWYDSTAAHHDCTAVYYDTCTDCGHRPLNIEVTERTRSWAYEYAQDLILFDYSIRNVGTERLRYVYLGILVDADVHSTHPGIDPDGYFNDVAGFLEQFPAWYLSDNCPADTDIINIGWAADENGNTTRPQSYSWVKSAIGVRFIRTPRGSPQVSFNWWSRYTHAPLWWSYGPQMRSSYRQSGQYGGLPGTDEEWYHCLRNGERDYDQAYQAIKFPFDATWVQPPAEYRPYVRGGGDVIYLLSIGPFGLDVGQTLKFTTALVAGDRFHRHRYIGNFLPDDPYGWYEKVWFDQLALNAMWAEWIYDNPGVDSDSDGYAGEYLVCDLGQDSTWLCDTLVDSSADPDTNYVECYWDYATVDTVWRKGDGVPDFRGAFPPPNPSTYHFVNQHGDTLPGLRVFPEVGKIRLVWNGVMSETAIDPFSHDNDFEGYRVYIALDNRSSSFSMAASYDLENWSRWYYDPARRSFVCGAIPFTLEQLRCMHADSCGNTTWFPHQFTRTTPLIVPGGGKSKDKIYFFTPMGANRSILANDPINANTDIKKVHPDAPRPPVVHPDSVAVYFPDRDDTTYFTREGYLKYFEYEYTFEDILPTIPYYVNVTALDHAHPELGLAGLEGDPAAFPKAVYPLPSSEVIAREDLKVFVYPNPYRGDADYRARHYEGRLLDDIMEDRTRLIHFANLPRKCTISIFSLDGDLIRQLKHDVDPLDYLANHDTWNLINRNMQLVVSGLYYWVVEDENGNSQIGKLVVIM